MALHYALYTTVGFQIVNNRNKGLGSNWTPAGTIFTNLLSLCNWEVKRSLQSQGTILTFALESGSVINISFLKRFEYPNRAWLRERNGVYVVW